MKPGKKIALAGLLAAAFASTPLVAQASTRSYNITATWYEPDTQPKNSIFQGSFDFDSSTHTVSNLVGSLSESMTGSGVGDMTWVTLGYQLVSWHDNSLGGTFAATFAKNSTATFYGNTWTPEDGINNGGIHAGWPTKYSKTIQNSYALIFVPDNPLAALSKAQLDKIAYADCAPGGMMGAVCMTGTSLDGYGSVGTMSGYPLSQVITATTLPVPEPESYAMFLAGLGLLGTIARRRRADS